MPFNGAGNYSPPAANFPAVANTLILSTDYNNVINDIATALSTCITKDGQTTIGANLPMSGFKHTGVSEASGLASRSEYASTAVFQDGVPKVISGIAGTFNAITGSLTPAITAYVSGQLFSFKPAGTNTGPTTININGVGAKNIFSAGAACVGGELVNGRLTLIQYDGTQFNIVGGANTLIASTAFARGYMYLASDNSTPKAVGAPRLMYNAGFTTSIAAGAITFTLTTQAGNTPSTSDPIIYWSQSNNAWALVTSAKSVTIPATATMGVAAGGFARIWLALMDNGELAVYNAWDEAGKTLYPLGYGQRTDVGVILSAGADAAGIMYGSLTVSNNPALWVGYAEWWNSIVTPGTWVAPDFTFLYNGYSPGDVLYENVVATSSWAALGTTLTPLDDTIPQITEGNLIAEWTPNALQRAPDVVRLKAVQHLSHSSTATSLIMHAHVAAGADAVASQVQNRVGTANLISRCEFDAYFQNPRNAIQLRVGSPTAGTIGQNGTSAARQLGGTLQSYVAKQVLMG